MKKHGPWFDLETKISGLPAIRGPPHVDPNFKMITTRPGVTGALGREMVKCMWPREVVQAGTEAMFRKSYEIKHLYDEDACYTQGTGECIQINSNKLH